VSRAAARENQHRCVGPSKCGHVAIEASARGLVPSSTRRNWRGSLSSPPVAHSRQEKPLAPGAGLRKS
jgi:hypothetical protein